MSIVLYVITIVHIFYIPIGIFFIISVNNQSLAKSLKIWTGIKLNFALVKPYVSYNMK